MSRQNDELLVEDLEWELHGSAPPGDVLRTIASMAPPYSILFLEGFSIASDVSARYRQMQVKPKRRIPSDYGDDRPPSYHLPATYEVLNEVADMFDKRDSSDVADHLKLYDSHGILFTWHDVSPGGWPILVSDRLDKELVRVIRKTHKLSLTRLHRA
jgi:hypothetical protein